MLWKILQGGLRLRPSLAVTAGRGWSPGSLVSAAPTAPTLPTTPMLVPVRCSGHILPPTQYDIPISKKFNLAYALVVYWEIIPLFITTCISILILIIAVVWAAKNKVDVVYKSRSRDSICRTMNLRTPTCHKMLTINQRYDPWVDMQTVLEKMEFAEKREAARKSVCKY